jgi:hypothetical protein
LRVPRGSGRDVVCLHLHRGRALFQIDFLEEWFAARFEHLCDTNREDRVSEKIKTKSHTRLANKDSANYRVIFSALVRNTHDDMNLKMRVN